LEVLNEEKSNFSPEIWDDFIPSSRQRVEIARECVLELAREIRTRDTLGERRSAEEYVTDDWAAVARAINQRATELGLRQRDLIERSHLSKAVVGEITRNAVQRRRSTRTLESLSIALDWHPQHLTAVLRGRRPPMVREPIYRFDEEDVPARLAAIEHHLREISERLNGIGVIADRLDEVNASLATVRERLRDDEKASR
jgi:hypothetical protein